MIKDILRIVRYKNLIIVAATMYIMRIFIMQPLLLQKGMELQLNNLLFLCLALATVCITAAGYVINDYFDTRTDLVNRPSTVVVGKTLSRRMVISLHWLLNLLGVGFGAIVSISIGKPLLVFVFLLVPGVLWFYSTTYKRQFLLGNLIVAFLTALVPLMVLLFELPKLQSAYWQMVVLNPSLFNDIIYWIGGYAIFAFWLTLFREIVKDIEDFEGDNEYGRRTLPIVLGIKPARMVAASILFVTIIILAYLFGAFLNFLPSGKFDYFTFLYLLIGLIIPLIVLIVRLLTAQSDKDYEWASRFTKIVMLIGILYAVAFRYMLN
ncbi:MAG: geranylgeranylglycerol-phosphate geranylgeranyltransferase [Bacteroidales bacterium]